MEASFDFSQWSGAELERAESTATQFLSEKQDDISHVLGRQCVVLGRLVEILRTPGLKLEEKLDCFARIAEVSQGIHECANGFFELGSQPLVARVLAAAK